MRSFVKETSMMTRATHLDDVGPHDLPFPPMPLGRPLAPARRKVVQNLSVRKDRRDVKPSHVLPQQARDCRPVTLLHLPQPHHGRDLRQRGLLDHPRERLEPGHAGEAELNELLDVERAVEVLALRDGRGEVHAGRVDGLEDAGEMAAPGDLLDEDGGEALGPELLVHAEEVDLATVLFAARCRWVQSSERPGEDAPVADAQVHRYARDEADQLAGGRDPHANVPVFDEAWWFEGPAKAFALSSTTRMEGSRLPLEKVGRVIEAERRVRIFNVVLRQ
jgi:hypothetical protein